MLPGPTTRRRIVTAATALVLAGALCVFATQLHGHYPVEQWLFWHYAGHWLLALWFGLTCWLSGAAVLRRFRVVLPRGERAVMQFALGLYLFFLAMFLGGLLHLYGPVFAVVMPLALSGLGLADALPRLRRYAPVLARAFRRPVSVGSPLAIAVLLFGLGGLLLVYFPILTPDNAAADTRWYHLTLAEHYAAQGGIARTLEGSFPAAYPQLATIIYGWAFQLPRTILFDRIEIAAHLEFIVFLWTLAGVGVLAQRLVPQCRARLAWVAIFLFPGIFLYDSNLSIAADHVLAFWAAPIFLTLLRAWERLEPRRCLLLAVVLAGAALTKYQAGCLVVLPALVLPLRAVMLAVRGGGARGRPWLGLLAAGAGALVLTAPHWAKNALWYHDPFYPLLHDHLAVRPWSSDASTYFERVFKANLWVPVGTLGERLEKTVKALFTFSFIPNDWSSFHGAVPVFGSLFTLTSFCVPFLGRQRRLWGLVLLCYGAVFIWYWGSHQDRYLQAVLPWMAAATAATLARLWQSGALVRALASLLVALQIVWGGDVPFFPGHAFIGTTPYKTTIDLLSTGYRKNLADRLHWPFTDFSELGAALPAGARVLIHGDLGPLGMGAAIVTDSTGWQGAISYGRYRSFAQTHQVLRGLGATHVLWIVDWAQQTNSLADDLVFYGFTQQHLPPPRAVGAYRMAALPPQAPPERDHPLVLFLGNGDSYPNGLYRMEALTVPGAGPHRKSDYPAPLQAAGGNEASLVRHAGFVVLEPAATPGIALPGFTRILRRGKYELWIRDREAPAPEPL